MRVVRLICALIFGMLAAWGLNNTVSWLRSNLETVSEQQYAHLVNSAQQIEHTLRGISLAALSEDMCERYLVVMHDIVQLNQELAYYRNQVRRVPLAVFQRAYNRVQAGADFTQLAGFMQHSVD